MDQKSMREPDDRAETGSIRLPESSLEDRRAPVGLGQWIAGCIEEDSSIQRAYSSPSSQLGLASLIALLVLGMLGLLGLLIRWAGF